jgi:membrane protease YdiL (CAAX protease family)
MILLEPLRVGGPLLLGLLAAWAVEELSRRKKLLPPGFASPARRGLALVLLWGVFYVGVFRPLGVLGQGVAVDLAALSPARLFDLHLLLVATLLIWYLLGFGRSGGLANVGRQFGLSTARPLLGEVGLGVAIGVGAWIGVLGLLLVVGLIVGLVMGFDQLPKEPPPVVPWLAGLPVGIRLAVSVSAGVVEETFFRGFLQPRIGIPLSTGMFVLAHLSYEAPFMLVGVTGLSLIYAFSVRLRGNIWPAVVAHALFDAVQLLVIIPRLLRIFAVSG